MNILECTANGAGACRNESMILDLTAERDAARAELAAARAEYRLLAERAKRVCEYYARNTSDWITLMVTLDYEPPLSFPGDVELKAARAEVDALRDAAEYRSLVDRCRERNKELGADCERLRDALVSLVDGKSEFDVEYDTGMPADEARKIMDLAYQRSDNSRQDAAPTDLGMGTRLEYHDKIL